MIPVVGRAARKRRILRALDRLEGYERAMRDDCALILELCDPDDDLCVEVVRLLERLES
jgi:hypothetical protein